jgi:hypothetical protein
MWSEHAHRHAIGIVEDVPVDVVALGASRVRRRRVAERITIDHSNVDVGSALAGIVSGTSQNQTTRFFSPPGGGSRLNPSPW